MLLKSKAGPSQTSKSSSRQKPELQAPPVDEQEQDFWSTPGTAPRTLHFTGELLTDEQIDTGDLGSLESPLPAAPKTRGTSSRAMQFTTRSRETSATPEVVKPPPPKAEEPRRRSSVSPEAEEDENATVVLKKPPPMETTTRRTAARSPPEPDPEPARAAAGTPDDASRRAKVKVTTELENVVVSDIARYHWLTFAHDEFNQARIWTTIGETIMPGHRFDVSGSSSAKPPRAKETM